jgi:hypothetical protein
MLGSLLRSRRSRGKQIKTYAALKLAAQGDQQERVMTPERWKQIYELVEAALDRGGEERVAFLDEACAGDDELRREVESLISYQRQASKFLEEPAFKHATDLFSDPQTEIESMEGQTISHYSILRNWARAEWERFISL